MTVKEGDYPINFDFFSLFFIYLFLLIFSLSFFLSSYRKFEIFNFTKWNNSKILNDEYIRSYVRDEQWR